MEHPNFSFRQALQRLDAAGLLLKVEDQVDTDLELTSILYKQPERAMLFKNVAGYDTRVVGNFLGSEENVLAIYQMDVAEIRNFITEGLTNPIPPKLVDSGPVQAVQAVLALAAGVLVYRVFRGGGDWRLKVSLLFVATFLASPQGFNYDLGLVSVSALCLGAAAMEHGWRRGEFTAAALCWTLPLTVMPLNALGAPIGPLLLAGMLAYLYRRLV